MILRSSFINGSLLSVLVLQGCQTAPELTIDQMFVYPGQVMAGSSTYDGPARLQANVKVSNFVPVKGLKIRLHGNAIKNGMVSGARTNVVIESHGPDRRIQLNAPVFVRTGDDSCEATINDFEGAPAATLVNLLMSPSKAGNESLTFEVQPLNGSKPVSQSVTIAVNNVEQNRPTGLNFSQIQQNLQQQYNSAGYEPVQFGNHGYIMQKKRFENQGYLNK